MTRRCDQPIDLDELIAYQAGELDAGGEERVEEHVFGCGECARRLEDLYRLGRAIDELARRGKVTTGATAALIDGAIAGGVRVRDYRLVAGDTVPCTCAPDDQFIAVRLVADVDADEDVDMEVETELVASGEVLAHGRDAMVVDRDRGEVIVLYAGDVIRAAPRSRWTMHLRARGPRGERRLGPFVLDHTPWAETV